MDKNYSVNDQANLIYQFILQHDLKNLTIVGHSFGGGVALITALKLNEEDSNRLSSLILIDSVAYPQPLPTFIKILRTPILGSLGLNLLSSKQQVRFILKLAYNDDSKISDEAISAYAGPLDAPGGHHALVQTARQMVLPDIEDISSRYKTIKVPTLLLWGRQDEIVPLQIGEQLHQYMPNSQLVIIEKNGHIPHEENPDKALSAIMDFLMTYNKPK